MKNSILTGVFLLSLVALAFPGCTKNSENHSQVKETVVAQETWTCPMHSHVRQDHPGTCPICGMNLVKIEKDEAHVHDGSEDALAVPEGHASFTLSQAREQMIGVQFGTVENKSVFKSIRAAGRLAFDPELYTAQNEYIEAAKQLSRVENSPIAEVKHSAKRMLESAKLRLKILGISDAQIRILGGQDSAGSNLLLNTKGGSAWVYAEVYEMDLPLIEPGQSADISASFLAGKHLTGKVVSVDRVINPNTRTAKVRIAVTGAKTLLRPESYVDVAIHAPLGEQVVVPFDAVLDTGDEAWVFVNNGQGRYEPRLITIKFRADDQVAIADGLKGGERIVTSANFLIDSESRLKGVVAVESDAAAGGGVTKTPSCPKGQHWDTPMAMCMPGAGS